MINFMMLARLQNSRIFCDRSVNALGCSNGSERSGANVKTLSETGERR